MRVSANKLLKSLLLFREELPARPKVAATNVS